MQQQQGARAIALCGASAGFRTWDNQEQSEE
jgi:hypothetical protein